MTNGNQLTREEHALLIEYQVLNHDQNTEVLSYWTLTGIFIGFSSALLGGLILGVLSNDYLTKIFSGKEAIGMLNVEFLIVGLISWVISMAVLVILYLLKRWLRRINFISYLLHQRMREIEFHFGMLKTFIMEGINNPLGVKNELDKLNELDREKAGVIRNRLESFRCRNRSDIQKNYEPPSGKWHHRWIFRTLMSLWALVLLGSLILFAYYSCFASLVATLIAAVIWIVILTRKHDLPDESCKGA